MSGDGDGGRLVVLIGTACKHQAQSRKNSEDEADGIIGNNVESAVSISFIPFQYFF